MSFKFGKISQRRLGECHGDLQKIANELIKEMDVSILCGHRNKKDQNAAYAKGHSRKKFPNSAHNKKPSLAMDIAPYPLDWDDLESFNKMRERVYSIASKLGIKLKKTISWDLPHVELEK